MQDFKIGVIGIKSRLGQRLIADYKLDPIDCDITSLDSISTALGKEYYDTIINCAAYTDVDGSEKNRLRAYAVNSFGPQNIAKIFNGHLVHISSDYIFDGSDGPYNEDAIAFPISGYGSSKYLGEVSLRPYMERTLIVRTTILYDNGPKSNFVIAVYNQLKEGKTVKVPKTLYGNPTHVAHLADGIMSAITKDTVGILNISGKTRLNRYETAIEIARFFDFDTKKVFDSPAWGEAKRPEQAGFILDRAKKLGIPLYSFWEGLHEMKKSLGLLKEPDPIIVPATFPTTFEITESTKLISEPMNNEPS